MHVEMPLPNGTLRFDPPLSTTESVIGIADNDGDVAAVTLPKEALLALYYIIEAALETIKTGLQVGAYPDDPLNNVTAPVDKAHLN